MRAWSRDESVKTRRAFRKGRSPSSDSPQTVSLAHRQIALVIGELSRSALPCSDSLLRYYLVELSSGLTTMSHWTHVNRREMCIGRVGAKSPDSMYYALRYPTVDLELCRHSPRSFFFSSRPNINILRLPNARILK